ncbi:cupin domain-containing protein [Pendulispora albinea]|uniref:Cupin domain-containing protein n=1 Tax=Pendulispora albinea TaxID=2741071 RepID=A0ABZ2LYN3_9BACT
MLFSECESFDYVRLEPGAVIDGRGRGDIEEAWFVLRGEGELVADGQLPLSLREGQLVLCSHGAASRWRAATDSPLELLFLALMPASVSRQLPERTPFNEH